MHCTIQLRQQKRQEIKVIILRFLQPVHLPLLMLAPPARPEALAKHTQRHHRHCTQPPQLHASLVE